MWWLVNLSGYNYDGDVWNLEVYSWGESSADAIANAVELAGHIKNLTVTSKPCPYDDILDNALVIQIHRKG